jgi:hypothetical protein
MTNNNKPLFKTIDDDEWSEQTENSAITVAKTIVDQRKSICQDRLYLLMFLTDDALVKIDSEPTGIKWWPHMYGWANDVLRDKVNEEWDVSFSTDMRRFKEKSRLKKVKTVTDIHESSSTYPDSRYRNMALSVQSELAETGLPDLIDLVRDHELYGVVESDEHMDWEMLDEL